MDKFSLHYDKKKEEKGIRMAFNYEKNKGGEESSSFWTSYSDLFLGMSVVFLLLYVTASLRTGTSGLQAQVENKKLSMQVQDLQNQLKMYDSVRKDYLNQEASKDETEQYNELMDKLSLLQEKAKDEREKLARTALELQTKEKALNQYQQLVRNMINANMLAKTKIKRRENVIEKQDVTIDDQKQEITQLEEGISEKQNQIAANERQIADANRKLDQRLEQLKQAYNQKKMTEKAYQAQMAKIKAVAQAKMDELVAANEEYVEELEQAQGQLGQVKQQLAQTEGKLQQTKGQLQATKGQLQATSGELQAAKGQLGQTAEELARTRGKAAQLAGELGQTKGKLGQLAGELGKTKGQLGQLEGELGKAKGQLGQAKGQIGQLQGDLAKAKAEADARREIARKIREGFSKAGVRADIDDRTGEVVINFGDVYFDSDSDRLKPQMKDVLKKAMPEYSKALFSDNKLRDKITSVEIVGFASPTYQGKLVDPKSLDPNVRRAIDYNMDLSYNRAKAIFNHVFDSRELSFQHQKDLLPLIKVTGRSFLAEKMSNVRNPSSKNYCDTHDCKKAQRVIIKFSFDDKK
ncbi:MAG: microtubule-binding protein [Bdellovibrionales bacterium]